MAKDTSGKTQQYFPAAVDRTTSLAVGLKVKAT